MKSAVRMTGGLVACLAVGIFIAVGARERLLPPAVQKAWRLTAISREQKSRTLGIRRLLPLTWTGGNRGGWNGPEPSGTMKLSACRATPLFRMLFRVPLFERKGQRKHMVDRLPQPK